MQQPPKRCSGSSRKTVLFKANGPFKGNIPFVLIGMEDGGQAVARSQSQSPSRKMSMPWCAMVKLFFKKKIDRHFFFFLFDVTKKRRPRWTTSALNDVDVTSTRSEVILFWVPLYADSSTFLLTGVLYHGLHGGIQSCRILAYGDDTIHHVVIVRLLCYT